MAFGIPRNLNPDPRLRRASARFGQSTLIVGGNLGIDENGVIVLENLDGFDSDDLDEGAANFYFTAERVDDRVATLLQDGGGIAWTYDDAFGTLTPAVDHGGVGGLGDDDHAQYHTDARALTWLGTRSTSDLAEGSRLYFTDERVDDRVSALLVAGSGISTTYNDGSNTLTVASTITQYTDELAQDAIGTILTDSSTIDFTYTDSTPEITATVKDSSITYAKIQNVSATDRLLGRFSASAGMVEEKAITDFVQGLLDDADAATFCTSIGLGTTDSPTFAKLTLTNQTLSTQSSFSGMSGSWKKTAGASDFSDSYQGLSATFEVDQTGGEVGNTFGLNGTAILTTGTVGNAVSGARNMTGLIGTSRQNGGVVTNNLIGLDGVVDQNTGTVSGNVIGVRGQVDADATVTGSVYLFYADERSGVDWAFVHEGGTAPSSFAGKVCIGTQTIPTGSGTRTLAFGDNGGNPTMGSNTAGVFAKDVAGTVELFAIDEGNVATQLSEHATDAPGWLYDLDGFPERVSRVQDPYTGQIEWTNRSRIERLLELQFAGSPLPPGDASKFRHRETYAVYNARMGYADGDPRALTPRDWDADQTEHVATRTDQIAAWDAAQARFPLVLTGWQSAKAEFEEKNPGKSYPEIEPIPSRNPRPALYAAKPKPKRLQ